MANQKTGIKPKADKKSPQPDGRRERSRSSRAKIVAAMLELVADGDVSPSAARVAETAGVGLRSVFRHFDDMDMLYSEMSDAMEAKIMPRLQKPYASDDWREQLLELVERRAEVFDIIMPYRISANIKRFRSAYLMKDYRRVLKMERDTVEAIIPKKFQSDTVRMQGILLALSFNSWRRLRKDEKLGIGKSKAVIVQMVEDIVAQIKG
jgi:AcrR family transcriptional regulator